MASRNKIESHLESIFEKHGDKISTEFLRICVNEFLCEQIRRDLSAAWSKKSEGFYGSLPNQQIIKLIMVILI